MARHIAPRQLLILDEAHHAAPSGSGRYGNESRFNRAVWDLGHRFTLIPKRIQAAAGLLVIGLQ